MIVKDKANGRFVNQNSSKYSAIHKWMVKYYGNPKNCENCGKVGSLNKGNRWNIHWANISGNYIRSRKDFVGLCVSCHLTKDKVILNIRHMKEKLNAVI